MTEKKIGMYTSGEAVGAEVERLKTFDYPNQVSGAVLPLDLTNKKVLDIGAGPAPALERIVVERHGTFIGADINRDFLVRRGTGLRVQADSRALPFADKSMDVVHARFMLMHMTPENRAEALKEMARVEGQEGGAVVLEYDWSSWGARLPGFREAASHNDSTSKVAAIMEMFYQNSRDLGRAMHIEMDMGALLPEETEKVLGRPVSHKRIVRPEGDYYDDLIGLAEMTAQTWEIKMQNKSKAEEMKGVLRELRALTPAERIVFSPADIVTVRF